MEDKQIKFKGQLYKEKYYDTKSAFGIALIKTFDKVEHAQDYTVTIKGNYAQMETGIEYTIVANPVQNEQWGWQYDVVNMYVDNLSDTDVMRKYLCAIVPKEKVDTLLAMYPDIVKTVIEDTTFEPNYAILRGIGARTFEKIKNKILDTYLLSELLALLSPLGVSFAMIKRVANSETNVSLLKEKILKNPYMLTSIPMLSFKRVDEFATKLHPDFFVSEFRMKSAIQYILDTLGDENGHSIIKLNDLKTELKKLVPQTMMLFENFILNEIKNTESGEPQVLYVKDDMCGLATNYKMEGYIYKKLTEINEAQNNLNIDDFNLRISNTNKELGFELSEQQCNIIKSIATNNVTIISGKAGCVDCDTEFFNGSQWKKISEWVEGEQVLQYNDGNGELVVPLNYIVNKADYLWHFHTKYGIDQCLSDEHNVYYVTQKQPNVLKHDAFKNIRLKHEESAFYGKFLTTYKYNGRGISLTDEEIRVMCAVICDGHFGRNTNRCRINIKKDRKKERMKKLLEDAKIEYEIKQWNPKDMKYVNYVFNAPIRTKTFESFWYDCTNHQLKIICDEIMYWDGCVQNNRMSFSSRDKNTIDFVQFAFTSCGYRVSIGEHERKNKIKRVNNKDYIDNGIDYTCVMTKNTLVGLTTDRRDSHVKTPIEKYKTKDGLEYCFTVPSGMLILRRNNKIFITGNCGKTVLTKGILGVYSDCEFNMCSLSAKAARRIVEATGFKDAKTIHRLLEYKGVSGFTRNENNPLDCDILVIDEASMVNVYLFYKLLKAVPKKCKIVIVGDDMQLPPIGTGAIFTDLLHHAKNFNTLKLTKIYRQAEQSGIVVDANKIRDGIMPFKKFEGQIISGTDKDMLYAFKTDRTIINNLIVGYFMEYIKKGVSISDVVVVVPRKDNCLNGTKEINQKIQEKIIPKGTPSIQYGKHIFKLGDRILNTVNNYKKDVMNGEVGTIIGIDSDYLTIDFDGNIVEYSTNELDGLELGYAMTVHKLQGSSAKYVIIGLDNTHHTLLSSNLIYTAITRSEKKCLIIAEPSAFQKGVKNIKENQRDTFLKDMLK